MPMSVNFFQISMIPISTYWDHIPRACKWNYLLKIQTPHLLPRVELNNKHLLVRVKLNKKRAHLDRLGNGRILNRNWKLFPRARTCLLLFFCQSQLFKILRFLVQQNTALFSTFRPSSVLRHRRDILTFFDILTVYTMKTIYFLNAYHPGW